MIELQTRIILKINIIEFRCIFVNAILYVVYESNNRMYSYSYTLYSMICVYIISVHNIYIFV